METKVVRMSDTNGDPEDFFNYIHTLLLQHWVVVLMEGQEEEITATLVRWDRRDSPF